MKKKRRKKVRPSCHAAGEDQVVVAEDQGGGVCPDVAAAYGGMEAQPSTAAAKCCRLLRGE